MTHDVSPPRWADALLRLLLRPADRESVSGDLLEAYRDSVRPRRGRWRADTWYVTQVVGFAWRSAWVWSVLYAGSGIGRSALDWFTPAHDFNMRSTVTTFSAVAIFACAGLWAAWRSRSMRAGVMAGVVTSAIGAVIQIVCSLVMLAIWHDPQTMAAIQGSGGLSEALTLPLMIVVPATLCATAGALVGKSLAWFGRSRLAE